MRIQLCLVLVCVLTGAISQRALAQVETGLVRIDDRSPREQELERLVKQLMRRVDALERRLDWQEKTTRRLAQQSNPQYSTQEAPPEPQAGRPEESRLGLHDRIAKLEEQAHKYANPIDAYWQDGLHFDTRSGDFKLKIGGRIQLDAAIMDADNRIERRFGDFDDGVEFRRARIFLSGDIYKDAFFKVQYDFAGGDADFKDVYMGLRNLPVVGTVRVGHFKEPFGLERLTSSNYLTFMERSIGTLAFTPDRNTGVKIYDSAFDERLTWAAGVFVNTDNFGDGAFGDDIHTTARLTGLPWYEEDGRKLLHLGVAYSHQNFEGDRSMGEQFARFQARPETHQAPRFIDTGAFFAESADLIGAELAWVHGPFSLQSEYVITFVDGVRGSFNTSNPTFMSFYVQASTFLTGEHRQYKKSSGIFDRLRPIKNFRENGGWGAWELAGRYSFADLDDARISGGELTNFTFGLNWYLNPSMRMMFNYVLADPELLGNANMFQLRFQVTF